MSNLAANKNYENFWKHFEDVAFNNEEFNQCFPKSKTIDRSYYILSLNNNDMGFVIRRNSENNCIDVYIRKRKDLFDFYNSHIDELNYNLSNKLKIAYTENIDKYTSKKFVLEYPYIDSSDTSLIEWAIHQAIQLKKNIDTINNPAVKKKYEYTNEDAQLESEIAAEPKSETCYEYDPNRKIEAKPKPSIVNGIAVYKRDKKVALHALSHADYKCEFNPAHKCFLKKDGITPYTEAHHLIPLSAQDDFDVKLDVEENVVSLCSNCHNEIHYGNNAKEIITKLYEERKKVLANRKIHITLEKLLSYYGY